MSVLHLIPVPGCKQAEIKFNQYKYSTKAPFVVYTDFKFILQLLGGQVKQTIYTEQHNVCASAAMVTSRFY